MKEQAFRSWRMTCRLRLPDHCGAAFVARVLLGNGLGDAEGVDDPLVATSA